MVQTRRQCTDAFTHKLLQWKSNKYYIFWVCVCSLRYPARNAHAILSSVACPAVQYFSTLSHKWHDFRKKVIENKMCAFTFSTIFSETFLILRKLSKIWSKKYAGLHVLYPIFLSELYGTWIFSTDFQKIHKYTISLESIQWDPELFHADGQTGRNQQSLFVILQTCLKMQETMINPSNNTMSSKILIPNALPTAWLHFLHWKKQYPHIPTQ